MNFQDISVAVRRLSNWYGFDLDRGLRQEDIALVDLIFKRRHLLLTTRAGWTKNYLRLTEDRSYQLNELITLAHNGFQRTTTFSGSVVGSERILSKDRAGLFFSSQKRALRDAQSSAF